MNKKAFFDSVRGSLFGGKLTQKQVAGIESIIDVYFAGDSAKGFYPQTDRARLAYILATAYHETGKRMEPVREAFGATDSATIAALNKAWEAGKLPQVSKPYWQDGWFGRGFVQLTFKENYLKMENRLGVPLTKNPGLALELHISCLILIVGMLEGLFTGIKLSAYVAGATRDFVSARRVVNGKDRAETIAGYARNFLGALNLAGEGAPAVSPPADAVFVPPAVQSPVAAFFSWLRSLFL